MSEVNRDIYPAGITGLHGIEIVSRNLNYYIDGNEWEPSIAVSQSMNPQAPFNRIDYVVPSYNETPARWIVEEYTRQVQKIGLTYIGTGTNFGNSNQYYNGSVDTIFIGAPGHMYYSYATLRKTSRTSFVVNCQSHYHANQYDILSGVNMQNILGVVCVGFTDGSACSLKYYLDNVLSITQTPSCIFMQVFYGHPDDSNVRRNIAPIDLSELQFTYWLLSGSPAVLTKSNATFYQGFPWAVGRNYTYLNAGTHPLKSALVAPSLIFPVIACIQGGEGRSFTWATTPTINANNSMTVIGGGYGEYYTLGTPGEGDVYYTFLTQKGIDDAMKVAATYGLPFAIDFPDDVHNLYSTTGLITYMPKANEGGYFDGAYEVLTVGSTLNPDLSLANLEIWTGGVHAPYDDRYYDPSIPIPIEEIELTHPTISPIGSFNQTYILNKAEVDSIQDYIYGADDTTLENFLKGISNFGGSPMDAFISLHMWPFDVRDFVTGSTTAKLVVGRTTISDGGGDVIGYVMPPDANGIIDCGHFHIDEVFESFLDYEPYTTINLFIPFVGSVDLAPSLYMGKTVSVKIICDWITGAMTAVVYADGIPLVYQQGIGAVSLSMTGDNHSRTAGDVLGGLIGAGASAVGAVAAAKTGNLSAALNFGTKAAEMAASAWNDYGRTDFNQAGSSSPMCSMYMPMYCYITISRPKLLYDDDMMEAFAEGVGFADSRISSLAAEGSSGSGIVVGAPVRVSFSGSVQPTPSEIDSILQALSTGVFPS